MHLAATTVVGVANPIRHAPALTVWRVVGAAAHVDKAVVAATAVAAVAVAVAAAVATVAVAADHSVAKLSSSVSILTLAQSLPNGDWRSVRCRQRFLTLSP